MPDPDVIVVGGGHNGLVCAAYLARQGMDVLVIEARSDTGGCAATVDALGARVNICNCDHVLVRGTSIIEELDLAAHGLRYLELSPHIAAIPWDGSAPWFGFHQLEQTLDSIAVGHPGQVDGYRRWIADALPVADLILAVTNEVPTLRNVASRVLAGRGVARMLAWNRMSAEEVLRRYLTDEALLAPILATAPTVWGLAPDTPGTGLAAANLALRHRIPPGRPVGGSGAFPDSVRAALEKAGGVVRCGETVDRIVVSGGRVAGVRLAGGDTVPASIVVGAVDPYRVFVEWLDGSVPERERWMRRDEYGYESKIDAVLTSAPALRGFDSDLLRRHGVADPLVPTLTLAPPLGEMARNHALLAQGRVGERPVLYANIPSALDESMRPADGGHVLSLEALFTPYRLQGGWDGSGEPARWLRLLGSVFELGFEESVAAWRHVGPRDYESDFGMPNGYATSFAGGPLAAVVGRPRELTRYRTSIGGLYLTGAATFPGAGVWGAAGRNAAHVILAENA